MKLPVPFTEYQNRIKRCKELAEHGGLGALVVFSHSPDRPGHVRYLSNYYAPLSFNPSSLPGQPRRRGMADSCVLIPVDGDPILIKAEVPLPECEIAISDVRDYQDDLVEALIKVIQEKHLDRARIGVAGEDVIAAYLLRLVRDALPDAHFEYSDYIIENLRQIKSENEIKLMRKTAEIADKALKASVEAVRVGLRERDIAAAAAATMLQEGCERVLFNDVQSGPNSELVVAWPMAGDRVIQEDDIVMIDLGGQDRNGYFFDVARTTIAGKGRSKAKRDILRLGRDATDFVAQIAMPGLKGVDWVQQTNSFVEERARKYNLSRPEPIMFIGHSMGLDMESLFYVTDGEMELKEGQAISIEPWIHVPTLGASRFEDLMLVTGRGGELLTRYTYNI